MSSPDTIPDPRPMTCRMSRARAFCWLGAALLAASTAAALLSLAVGKVREAARRTESA